jgi:hypothetical protein
VNPYLATTLAMCVIAGLSLAATAYLAVAFNRRAKRDLEARLAPLAEAIGGEANVEDAVVSGRYERHLAFGRVANGAGGIGRVFRVEIVDAAGGDAWEWSSLPVKGQPQLARSFEGGAELEQRLGVDWVDLSAVVPDAGQQRYGFAYDPASGMLRLTRAMRSRLDIPNAPAFLRQLDALVRLGRLNRRAQGAPDADLAPSLTPPVTPSAADGTAADA